MVCAFYSHNLILVIFLHEIPFSPIFVHLHAFHIIYSLAPMPGSDTRNIFPTAQKLFSASRNIPRAPETIKNILLPRRPETIPRDKKYHF